MPPASTVAPTRHMVTRQVKHIQAIPVRSRSFRRCRRARASTSKPSRSRSRRPCSHTLASRMCGERASALGRRFDGLFWEMFLLPRFSDMVGLAEDVRSGVKRPHGDGALPRSFGIDGTESGARVAGGRFLPPLGEENQPPKMLIGMGPSKWGAFTRGHPHKRTACRSRPRHANCFCGMPQRGLIFSGELERR